ncbi:MAG: hypothetical protein AB7L92_05560 [Alphaproteobacteria bacterium]
MKLPSAFTLMTLCGAYAAFYFLAIPVLVDADVVWHIAAGDRIMATGHVPTENGWAFTEPQQPWYLISWLWNLLLHGLHDMGGLATIFIASVLCMTVVAGFLAHRIDMHKRIGSEAKLLTIFVACLGLVEFVSGRPHVGGYLLVVVTHLILHSSRDEKSRRLLFVLPLLFAAWANIHGSFIAGFTLLFAYCAEALLTRNRPWLKALAAALLACVAALWVNPYGGGLFTGVFGTLGSQHLATITEWGHFVFGESLGLSMWLLIFVIAWISRDKTAPLADRIISLGWLAACMFSFRNAGIFILVSAPYMAMNLQSMLTRLEHIRTHRPDPLAFVGNPRMQQKLALVLVVLMVAGSALLPLIRGERWRADKQSDPGPAVAYVLEHLKGRRVLNDYDYGGRIIYESAGTFPVFIDPRFGTAYSETLIQDYLTFLLHYHRWEDVIAKHRIDAILISNHSIFAQEYLAGHYHKHWQQVYKDEVAGVYVRK